MKNENLLNEAMDFCCEELKRILKLSSKPQVRNLIKNTSPDGGLAIAVKIYVHARRSELDTIACYADGHNRLPKGRYSEILASEYLQRLAFTSDPGRFAIVNIDDITHKDKELRVRFFTRSTEWLSEMHDSECYIFDIEKIKIPDKDLSESILDLKKTSPEAYAALLP